MNLAVCIADVKMNVVVCTVGVVACIAGVDRKVVECIPDVERIVLVSISVGAIEGDDDKVGVILRGISDINSYNVVETSGFVFVVVSDCIIGVEMNKLVLIARVDMLVVVSIACVEMSVVVCIAGV